MIQGRHTQTRGEADAYSQSGRFFHRGGLFHFTGDIYRDEDRTTSWRNTQRHTAYTPRMATRSDVPAGARLTLNRSRSGDRFVADSQPSRASRASSAETNTHSLRTKPKSFILFHTNFVLFRLFSFYDDDFSVKLSLKILSSDSIPDCCFSGSPLTCRQSTGRNSQDQLSDEF